MKIRLNRLVKPNKVLKDTQKVKAKNVQANISDVMKDIDYVKLNFESKAEHLSLQEYLSARSYLANAEMEQLYKVMGKDL